MRELPAANSENVDPARDQSFAHIASLLNGMPALFWTTNADLILTAVSGGALHEEQRESDRYMGRPIEALFGKTDTKRKVVEAHRSALRGRRSSFTAQVNGRELQAWVEPWRGPDGDARGAIGIAIDSTERLVTERAIRISEQSYRSLIEEAPSAILRATMSGQLLQVNRAMLEMLGYDRASEQELLIRDLPLIFLPGKFDEFKRGLAKGQVIQGMESTWLRRDSREIHVRLSGRAMHTEGQATSYMDIVAEDVTERKQLEMQLIQARKMQAIGQLAGGVAHDFNNLLTVIIGHVEMLGGTGDTELRASLSPVREAADRAAMLTRQLLAFSRQQVFQSRVIDVNEVIGRFGRMLARLIKETVQLTLTLDPASTCVCADPHQIEQVLMNLALNAQDAMQSGGSLTIGTANIRIDSPPAEVDALAKGEYVRITVRDTGAGMDAATLAHLFEPFFTTKPVGQGTGLGLSMVYGIVRQSGGQIVVSSEPDAGSTFEIYLPRLAAPAHQPEKDPIPSAPRPGGNETILIAEDEGAVRKLVATVLGKLGYTVLTAHDGQAALDLADSCPGEIHLLLTDLIMPRVGGRELAMGIKEFFPGIKVVFMSGYAGQDANRTALEMPGTLFLAKPLSMDVLARAVRTALDGTSASAGPAD